MGSFAQNLSSLRKDHNISQRKAAADLNISQALLSHYENGIREPKLEFIIKVSKYYNVSTDFILGCTNIKENLFTKSTYPQISTKERCVIDIVNMLIVVFNLLDDLGNDAVLNDASYFVELPVYKLYNILEHFRSNPSAGFSPELDRSNAMCDIAIKLMSLNLTDEFSKLHKSADTALPQMSTADLEKRFEDVYTNFAKTFSEIEDRLKNTTAC